MFRSIAYLFFHSCIIIRSYYFLIIVTTIVYFASKLHTNIKFPSLSWLLRVYKCIISNPSLQAIQDVKGHPMIGMLGCATGNDCPIASLCHSFYHRKQLYHEIFTLLQQNITRLSRRRVETDCS